jgi:hypothetical protein
MLQGKLRGKDKSAITRDTIRQGKRRKTAERVLG